MPRPRAKTVAAPPAAPEPENVRAHIIGYDTGGGGEDRFDLLGLRSATPRQRTTKRAGRKRNTLAKADQLSNETENSTLELDAVAYVDDLLQPRYDPHALCAHFLNSNALRQNVDAYATNIEGFGHHFEPTFRLDAEDARIKVREALYLDRLLKSNAGEPELLEPTDEEVEDRIAALRREMLIEKSRLDSFFKFCCYDMPFVTLRKRTRQDMEITGNGYWEVIRNAQNIPARFVLMPSHTMRIVARQSQRVDVTEEINLGPLTFQSQKSTRRFRRYVQHVSGDPPVYFKEFGDPRVMSSKTGKYYPTLEAMKAGDNEEDAAPANEVIHFVVHSPMGPYGVPRWIGNLLSVLGSRCAEEVNFTYFENKSIPPLIITVSGGRMSAETTSKIRSFIENDIKGKRNFHKILVLEAEAGGAAAAMGLPDTGKCRIEVKPLTEAHLKDALFQEYDSRNMDKVGMSFRLPRLLRGDIRDFNRASAQASIEFAETQVFGPERAEIDFVFNRMILPALKVRYYEMISQGPRITDPTEMVEAITKLTNAGNITPAEGHELAGERVFYKEMKPLKGDWQHQPMPLTAAGIGIDGSVDGKIPDPGGDVSASKPASTLVEAARKRLTGHARELIKLRDLISEAEARDALTELKKAKAGERVATVDALETEVVNISPAEMKKRFGIEPAA